MCIYVGRENVSILELVDRTRDRLLFGAELNFLFGTPEEPAVDSNHRTLGLLVGQENVGLRVDLSYRQCHVSTGRDTRGSSDRVLG